MTLTPPDQASRHRIATDLDTTLFVEAGAGSGKTTALVGRVVALVTSGDVELRNLAAITFTEKAGAELRDRVRRELQARAAGAGVEADRCRLALTQLDGAAIGTLHAFAQRILSEHPVEAMLPPKVEVLDEVSSAVAFDRRWARVLDRLLEDEGLERTILLLHTANVDPTKLRSLALAFERSWDLVEDLVPARCPEPPQVANLVPRVLAELATLGKLADVCIDPSDKLLACVNELVAFGEVLAGTGADDLDLLEVLSGAPGYKKNVGRAQAWKGCKDDVLAQLQIVADALAEVRRTVLDACAHRLGSALRATTLAAADRRRADGRLEFHDLLVLARKVLRHPVQGPVVRAQLRERYQRLLLDEFQDTDPIQIELAVRIAAADPANAGDGGWPEVDTTPGRLFVVGDPKQSIYRFRRADISVFMAARARFAPDGPVELTANFRTVSPVIHWVNATFGALFREDTDQEVADSQPHYIDLQPVRPAPTVGPAVGVIGGAAHEPGTNADDVRTAEGRDVAHVITTALAEGWHVRDGEDGWRPCRLGDITILVPARTSLPFLEDELEAAGIPYRAESSSLVYATRAVRDLLMVLRAADDPTDHLRIVSALRTPLLGCGDDDLFEHKVLQGRSWSYNTPTPPDPTAGVVSAGLAFLLDLHQARHWQSPAELLDRIARERRALELGFAEGRPRDAWRRVRFVIDQARAWSEATGGSLRAYLHWVEQQTTEGSRVAESVLPETDDDAVRIMTIHAAKGLEFPITIVSGLSARPGGQRSPVEVHFPRDGGPVGYRMGRDVVTQEFEAAKPLDEQMGYDERLRLLYVACTRACDHLVLSLHRVARRRPPEKRSSRTNAEVLEAGMGDRLVDLPDLSGDPVARPLPPASVPAPPPPFDAWAQERAAALDAAGRPGAVAATALSDEGGPDRGADPHGVPSPTAPVQGSLFDDGAPAAPTEAASVTDPWVGEAGDPGPAEPPLADEVDPGLQKRPRDLDLPPWLKGRYGTAVGRAVHGVLQTIDLGTGAGLDDAVAAQCHAEAVPDRADDVRTLVQDALGAPSVVAASGSAHWREVYACTPIGDRLLEGYVDLLYRAHDGLVVVDHKTSASADPEELDRRVAGYRLQGAAYAVAVGRATGELVARVVFLFLTPQGAVERELVDLHDAMADVERLVAAGQELVTA
ncbi:MAG: UvrD-helicase domain-containing protein [Acidimicrobiales bacterium]